MPTGSGDRALYPSVQSWLVVLDALAAAFPDTSIALTGKLAADRQTASSLTRAELERLLAHRSRPLNCFDIDLAEQLAVVAACRVFVAPHTGFGMAALAVGTPWLAISGGRYFEYFFNHVPFRSVIPDVERYPCFTQMHKPPETIDDDGEGTRTTSMTRRRIVEDLDRIVAAAEELVTGSLTYERALKDYFTALLEAFRGDASSIWSIDDVHLDYLPGHQPKRP